MPGIPPTPQLSRRLFSRNNDMATPAATTAEEKACDNEPFYTSVSRLIMQSIPSLELDKINITIEAFFATYHIENEEGFLPSKRKTYLIRTTHQVHSTGNLLSLDHFYLKSYKKVEYLSL